MTAAVAIAPDLVAEPDPLEPVHRLNRWRVTRIAVGASVFALPLLRPSGPGNTGLVDVALVGGVCASAMWASTRSHRIRLPYALPVLVMVLAGAIAVALNWTGGESVRGGLALLQDLFVLGWAAAVATLGRDRQLLDLFCRMWAYSAAFWAGLLIFGELAGITAITGINSRDGLRASLTFGDPNLAADYFVVSLLVLRACRRPRQALRRYLCATLIVVAIVLTLSNGGLLALLVATLLGALFRLATKRGLASALTVALGVALSVGALAATVDLQATVNQLQQSDALVRDSLGRDAESSGSRSQLASESLALWLTHDTSLGFGPANTESTLRGEQAPYVKEAHDDYLATLLERGVLGGVGLILLGVAVGIRSRRICRPGGVPPAYLAIVPRPELLAAAVVAVAISASFYEVLHFRHVWALFGLVAALEHARWQR